MDFIIIKDFHSEHAHLLTQSGMPIRFISYQAAVEYANAKGLNPHCVIFRRVTAPTGLANPPTLLSNNPPAQ